VCRNTAWTLDWHCSRIARAVGVVPRWRRPLVGGRNLADPVPLARCMWWALGAVEGVAAAGHLRGAAGVGPGWLPSQGLPSAGKHAAAAQKA
jgi:hypothetical protein